MFSFASDQKMILRVFMGDAPSKLRAKLRIFLPIAIIIVLAITILTIVFIRNSLNTINEQMKERLSLEVYTISKMFDREKSLKLEKVETALRVTRSAFDNMNFSVTKNNYPLSIVDQNTHISYVDTVNEWMLGGLRINGNYNFVDSIQNMVGGTVTIFQKVKKGYVRISTNVLNEDSTRAVGTYIPNDSPVILTIEKNETYYGRAYVVNDWYITAYSPLYDKGKLVGMLYVGGKEKNLPELRNILNKVKIGETGHVCVFTADGEVLVNPEYIPDGGKIFDVINAKKEGIYKWKENGESYVASYIWYEPFDLYITAFANFDVENKDFFWKTILTSVLIAVVVITILSLVLFFLTAERIFRFLVKLETSRKKLSDAKIALEQSEDRFRKLFDSTGDEIFVTNSAEQIIEVNQAVINNLGYSREEICSMKMIDIKPDGFAEKVAENRQKIYSEGQYTFESKHVAKNGSVIPVEITSRVVDYNNEKLILSVSRNIKQRKETEMQILSTVIQTEERERERFAKDMHDGLGPLLSTIKLYVNELKSGTLPDHKRDDFAKTTLDIIDEALISTRTISNNLMPRVIHKFGLITALESFFEKVNKTRKINIEFKPEGFTERLDQNIELVVFRVITELLNNTLKHAQANSVLIEMKGTEKILNIRFADDGVGFDVDNIMNQEHKGMGLKNIISRVKSINGYYNFISSPGNGFSIDIKIEI